jgi:lipoprotein signal peptidase
MEHRLGAVGDLYFRCLDAPVVTRGGDENDEDDDLVEGDLVEGVDRRAGCGASDRRRMFVRFGWVLGLVLLDLVSKAGVFAHVGALDAAGELVRDHDGHRRLPLFGTEWFAFMLSTNPGAAFGQLGDIPHLLVALRIACVFMLGSWLVGAEGVGRASIAALTLVLAGAAGNLYDNLMLGDSGAALAVHCVVFFGFGIAWCSGRQRLRWGAVAVLVVTALILELTDSVASYGEVRDFIDVYTPQWRTTLPWGSHFPTFNVADSCISVGAVLLILTGWGHAKGDGAAENDGEGEIAEAPPEG